MSEIKWPLGEKTYTRRGFEIIEFRDINWIQCSLQASSLAEREEPGTSAIWLGCNEPNPRELVPGKGWTPVAMPKEYLADTRVHLNRKQVAELVERLQNWLNTGSFGK